MAFALDAGRLPRPQQQTQQRQQLAGGSAAQPPRARRAGGRRCADSRVACQSSPGLTSSVPLGPSTEKREAAGASGQTAAEAVDAVELRSEAGQDYSALRDALKAGEWQAADDETRALLIRLAGPDAEKRGWVYFTEVKFIPEADLRTVDSLWSAASKGRYGYSVQKELWLQCRKQWPKFLQQIDWVQGEMNFYRKWPQEFIYTADAAKGHLPLTNALRGTQLFKALMEHPAFVNASKDNPDWLK